MNHISLREADPAPALDAEATDALIHEAAEIAARYLAGHADRNEPTVRHFTPAELSERFDLALPHAGRPIEAILEDVRKTLHYSVRTGHPGFSNQLYGDYDPVAVIGEWMTALLNTSAYTYEVAPVVSMMEVALVRHMCGFVGWPADLGEGVFTPGGSIANLMAVLAARGRALPHVRERGLQPGDRLALFMSEEAHYSVERAAIVAGIGTCGVHKVAVDRLGRMLPDALETAVRTAVAQGQRPFFVCATASTTVAGAFDPIDDLAEVAGRERLWLHVDAACGGGVLLSEQRRALMRGCELADSVTWDPHKMMGQPLMCSVLLVRERGRLAQTNAMRARYLFHDNDGSAFDLGDLGLQCGRRVDSLKLWLSWNALGDEGHARRIDRLFELAQAFRGMVIEREGFELLREPQGCNTCFHFVPESLRGLRPGRERSRRLGEVTVRIRERLRREGRILTNYAPLDGVTVFRHVASNHRATEEDLAFLLDEIARVGAGLEA